MNKHQRKITIAAGLVAAASLVSFSALGFIQKYKEYLETNDRDLPALVAHDISPKINRTLEDIASKVSPGAETNKPGIYINLPETNNKKIVPAPQEPKAIEESINPFLLCEGSYLNDFLSGNEKFLQANLSRGYFLFSAALSSELNKDNSEIESLIKKGRASGKKESVLDMRELLIKRRSKNIDFSQLEFESIKKTFKQQLVAHLCYELDQIKYTQTNDLLEKYRDTQKHISSRIKSKYSEMRHKEPNLFSLEDWKWFDNFIEKY